MTLDYIIHGGYVITMEGPGTGIINDGAVGISCLLYTSKHNGSLVGSMCLECLDYFKVDKTILSIDGISIENGVTEYNTEEAAVLRKMIHIGNIRMILCEFSKFTEVALNRVCKAEEVDFVFTDWNISAKEIKAWSDVGTKVIPATRE